MAGKNANLGERTFGGFVRWAMPKRTPEQKSGYAGWVQGIKDNPRGMFSGLELSFLKIFGPDPAEGRKMRSRVRHEIEPGRSSTTVSSFPGPSSSSGTSSGRSDANTYIGCLGALVGFFTLIAVVMGIVASQTSPYPPARIIDGWKQNNPSPTPTATPTPTETSEADNQDWEPAPENLGTTEPPPERPERFTPPYEPPSPISTWTAPIAVFWARHKHRMGGCDGQIQLRENEFRFISSRHPVTVERLEIKHIDGPGFVDSAGHKWHFKVEGKTEEEFHDLLAAWFGGQSINDILR